MESICRSGYCYLHQNRFLGRNLYDIDNIAFVDVVSLPAALKVDFSFVRSQNSFLESSRDLLHLGSNHDYCPFIILHIYISNPIILLDVGEEE
jgi:hypothetical protein